MTPKIFIIEKPEQLAWTASFITKQVGFPIEVTVKDYVPKRSSAQNRRLWKLHAMAGKEIGCTPEDCHEDMLCKFYGFAYVKMPSGETKRVPLQRSSQRDKKEFQQFLEDVEMFYGSELNVWIGENDADLPDHF